MKKGLIIFAAGYLFGIIETKYFLNEYGWHFYAYNNAERICDSVSLLLTCTGIAMIVIDAFKELSRS